MMTFRHRHIVDADPTGRRMRSRASSLSSLEPLPHFSGRSPFNLSSKARVVFGIIGIFAGAYACSSSAFAEVEEDTNQEVIKPGYTVLTLPNDITTNLLIDSYTYDDVAGYISTLDSSRNDGHLVHRDAETYTGNPLVFVNKSTRN